MSRKFGAKTEKCLEVASIGKLSGQQNEKVQMKSGDNQNLQNTNTNTNTSQDKNKILQEQQVKGHSLLPGLKI